MSAAENVVNLPIKTKLVCRDCGAPGQGSCLCDAPYVTPGERAKAAAVDPANADKGDRMLADELGVSHTTVQRARKSVGTNVPTEKRKGKGGKKYKATKPPKPAPPIKTVDDKGRVAGVDIKVDPPLWQAFNEKAQREQKSATAKIAELIISEIEPSADLRVELPKTAQEKLDATIRHHRRKLDAEHEARLCGVDEEVRLRVIAENKDYLAMVKEQEAKARADEKLWREIIDNHRPLFTADQFKTILMCLHPDGHRTADKLSEAFRLFNGKKVQLTGAR